MAINLVTWGGHFGEPKSKAHIYDPKTQNTVCGIRPGLRSGGAVHAKGTIHQVTCARCRAGRK